MQKGQSGVAMVETRLQFENLEEGEHPLLEAVTRRLVKAVNEDTTMCNSYL
jgi:hypothetical protein